MLTPYTHYAHPPNHPVFKHIIILSILLESVWQRPVVLLTLVLVDPVVARHNAMVGGDTLVA
jgi:hypothetical protein